MVSKRRPITKNESEALPPKSRIIYAATKSNNIRNWRLFRGFPKQRDLAMVTKAYDPAGKGLPRVTICKLENGELRYNEGHLTILSRALRVSPRDLIGTNPYDSGDIFAVFAGLSERDKHRVTKFLVSLKR